MIRITYSSREPPALTIKGHANYAEYGKDIVCAAVSVLFETLVEALGNYTDDAYDIRGEPGDCSIVWQSPQSETGRLLMMAFLDGFRSTALSYPDHAMFNIE